MKILALVFITLGTSAFGSGERLFAPNAERWDFWMEFDAGDTRRIDHRIWDRFLKKYLGLPPRSRLDYATVGAAERKALSHYISTLADLEIKSFNRNEQYAYWVNLYNALVVKLVLDHYPVETIQDINISPGFFASGPWDAKLVRIQGQDITLNDIEHRILRPLWKESRTHYALNCASIGCPVLQSRAMTSANRDDYLEAGAREFINSERGVRIKEGKISVSKIYDWFLADFGENEEQLHTHLKKFARPQLRASIEQIGKIDSVHYDWRLNDIKID